MSLYRYCGAGTEVGDLKLDKFGQIIEFSDALASEVILGGGCIVPAAEFDSIGFTEQELSIYSDPMSHGEANTAFQSKKKRALLANYAIRQRLLAGEPFTTAAPAIAKEEAHS